MGHILRNGSILLLRNLINLLKRLRIDQKSLWYTALGENLESCLFKIISFYKTKKYIYHLKFSFIFQFFFTFLSSESEAYQ